MWTWYINTADCAPACPTVLTFAGTLSIINGLRHLPMHSIRRAKIAKSSSHCQRYQCFSFDTYSVPNDLNGYILYITWTGAMSQNKWSSRNHRLKFTVQLIAQAEPNIRRDSNLFSNFKCKGKGKGNYLTSVAKQAKTAFLHGPTVWKSPIWHQFFKNFKLWHSLFVCPHIADCYSGNGEDYNAIHSHTVSGYRCQAWAARSEPTQPLNRCRVLARQQLLPQSRWSLV